MLGASRRANLYERPAILRLATCFVKRETTICCDFLLGHSQYMDPFSHILRGLDLADFEMVCGSGSLADAEQLAGQGRGLVGQRGRKNQVPFFESLFRLGTETL